MNVRQKYFLSRYLTHFNATKAAIEAGYSERSARAIGARLLTNDDIKAEIDAHIMSADEAAINITEIASGDMADLMSITTSGFTLELMVKDPVTGNMIVNPKTKLIKKIKQKVTTYLAKKEDDEDREIIETEIELYDRHAANRDILKYRGKLVDRSENLNIDLSTLTDEQLEMMAQGKSITDVLKHASA
jgi:phage terminase small subunit